MACFKPDVPAAAAATAAGAVIRPRSTTGAPGMDQSIDTQLVASGELYRAAPGAAATAIVARRAAFGRVIAVRARTPSPDRRRRDDDRGTARGRGLAVVVAIAAIVAHAAAIAAAASAREPAAASSARPVLATPCAGLRRVAGRRGGLARADVESARAIAEARVRAPSRPPQGPC